MDPMAYLPRPAYYPVPVGQAPPSGYTQPSQNFPGFPPGFNPGRYAAQVTPEMARFSLLPNELQIWNTPATGMQMQGGLEVSSDEEDSDTGDDDDDSLLDTPPPLQAYYHAMENQRGRSRSRSGAHHTGRSATHSVPKEYRRLSLPLAISQQHFHQNETPHLQQQALQQQALQQQALQQQALQQQALQQQALQQQALQQQALQQQALQQQAMQQQAMQRQNMQQQTLQQQAIQQQALAALLNHQSGPPNATPFRQQQPLLTPLGQAAPLPFQHEQHQPHAYPTFMQPHPAMAHMQHQPAHPAEQKMYYTAPQPPILPNPKEKKRSRSMSKVAPFFRRAATILEQFTQGPSAAPYGMIPNPKWGKEAARQAIIDPTRASSKVLKSVLIHPLLAPGCRDLMILNTIRPPAVLTAVGNHSLQEYFSDPATSPPMSQITLWTGVHEHPLTIGNPHGVTIANVLGCIGDMMFAKIKRPSWNAFSEQKRTEIARWFHHNREIGLMPPIEKGVRYADLLGPNTMFFGMELCKQLPDQPTPPGTFVIRWGQPI